MRTGKTVLGDMAGPQLTEDKEMGISDLNLANNLNELRGRFFLPPQPKE